MQRYVPALLLIFSTVAPPFAGAITPGDDLLIAGAARTSLWVSDLYINNPADTAVTVTVMWLERGRANPDPETRSFTVGASSTLILADVIRESFGRNRGAGAFRITSEGGAVTANLVVAASIEDSFGARTLGSAFEGVPSALATAAGETSTVMGIVSNSRFRTNLFATAGASGCRMELDLVDPWGPVIDSIEVDLAPYEPWFGVASDLWDGGNLANATVAVRVAEGSVVLMGSRIDNHPMSQDPTTLEPSFGAVEAADGAYQFAAYDSLGFAGGGRLVVEDAAVTILDGTYFNFDKVDDAGESSCPLIFRWGAGFTSVPVESVAGGVEFSDAYPDGGTISWMLTFTIDANLGYSGRLEAVGAGFTGVDEGCNGRFPTLTVIGGKER